MRFARAVQTAGPGIGTGTGTGTGGRYLRVDPEDPGFASIGCDNWILADTLNPVLDPGLDIPAGMFLIGRDISPGRYTTTAGAGCEWSILSDARPGATVLATGHGAEAQAVVIPDAAAFFASHDCAPFHEEALR